jgi:gamma-glutamylcysteine synthetase
MNVTFSTDEKDVVEFNQDGDASAHYDIMNFQIKEDGSYDYVQIGDWINHTLNFFKPIQYPSIGAIKSVCSDPCPMGYYKVKTNIIN